MSKPVGRLVLPALVVGPHLANAVDVAIEIAEKIDLTSTVECGGFALHAGRETSERRLDQSCAAARHGEVAEVGYCDATTLWHRSVCAR